MKTTAMRSWLVILTAVFGAAVAAFAQGAPQTPFRELPCDMQSNASPNPNEERSSKESSIKPQESSLWIHRSHEVGRRLITTQPQLNVHCTCSLRLLWLTTPGGSSSLFRFS
jgi:hypothetical protein